jgi:hypothetical protein
MGTIFYRELVAAKKRLPVEILAINEVSLGSPGNNCWNFGFD